MNCWQEMDITASFTSCSLKNINLLHSCNLSLMIYRWWLILIILTSFQSAEKSPYIVVLGTAQDAGYPQAGCDKECCKKYWDKKIEKQKITCLSLFDPVTNQKWLFDATPDFTEQLQAADKIQW